MDAMGKMMLTQFSKLPLLVDESTCKGKTYVVTGSNIGLGLEVSRHLVAAGAKTVIVAVRNLSLGENAKADIEKTTGRTGVVLVRHLNMSTYAAVQKFSKEISAELDTIDGFFCNAGVYLDQFELFEGIESVMFVNVVNTLFLAILMMPKLRETAKKTGTNTTVVFSGSVIGYLAKAQVDSNREGVIFENFSDEKRAIMDTRYNLSKIVLELCVRQFAARFPVEKTGVLIALPAPGLCWSRLARDAKRSTRIIHTTLLTLFARSSEMGSRALLHALVVGKEGHGKLLSDCVIKEYWTPDWVVNEDGQQLQRKLWEELVERLEKVQPGCVSSQL